MFSRTQQGVAALIAAASLFMVGVACSAGSGPSMWGFPGAGGSQGPGSGGMMGPGGGYGGGMMGPGMGSGGMMGPGGGYGGMMGPGMGSGGMMGPGMGSGGMMGPGMGSGGMMGPGMGSGGMRGPGGGYAGPGVTTPLTAEAARAAIQAFADRVSPNLAVTEVMVFSNHAYGIVAEKDTGLGAFEVLVDHGTGAVMREPGPGMMWNLKYPVMGGRGSAPTDGDMPVSEAAATQAAQRYLDSYAPGATVEGHANRFYGYYTLDIARNGQTAGMLSVNGFTGAVFFHNWHGTFIAEQEFAAR